MVTAKALQRAVADLQHTRPGPGLLKVAECLALGVPLLYVAFTCTSYWVFLFTVVCFGSVMAAFLITTHDAIHHTLTGWGWFDEILPRLISWPINWCHSVYAEVHKLHHKMNGDDTSDPERIQWTLEEYQQASSLMKFYVRHQWFIDIFVLGGYGLIFQTFRAGLRFADRSKGMRRALWLDVGGIIASNILVFGVASLYGHGWRWLVMWLVTERFTGGVLQWRAHVEHYGLWGKGRHYFETQSYNCRNLRTNELASWFFNRLNFHSVHHAFPRVPFYNLRIAHERFLNLYRDAGGEPLVEESGYVATSWRLAKQPSVIGHENADSPSHRRQIVPISDIDRQWSRRAG
jgi:fatty acid desaturase